MRPIGIVLGGWIFTAVGAVLGSVAGNLVGPRGMFAGAIAGGMAGIALVTEVFRRLGWLTPPHDHRARFMGLIGLCLAAPLARMTLDTPITPILAAGFVGLAMLVGARWPGRQRS
jgi:hypothetical protein